MSTTNDTISNFLAQVKNAYLARHKSLRVSYTNVLSEIAKILEKEKFIKEVKVVSEDGRKALVIGLSYPNRRAAIENIKRVSKPGLRVYVSKDKIPYVLGGLGIAIISTPQGIMTGRAAKGKNIGGEVICKVW